MSQPSARIPALDLVLGYGPALAILAAGAGAWLLPAIAQPAAVFFGWLWASAILLFLAGVTRGLSFFTPGGPRRAQVVQSVWLFVLASGALATPGWIGFVPLILGYASVGLFDPPAARSGLAPAHFARLRPPQMAIAVVGLALLLLRALQA